MRIALLSDLHMEFGGFLPGPEEDIDVYVLAGDIDSGGALKTVKKILHHTWLSDELVIIIPGNHEFYGDSFSGSEWNRDHLWGDDDKTVFIATTLWSDPDPSRAYAINDFYKIEGMTPEVMSKAHQEDKQYLFDTINLALKDGMEKIVVVTHYLPSIECVAPGYKNSKFNSFFVSSTMEDIWQPSWNGKVVAWLYGHTHTPADFIHSYGVRMVCNSHGYQGVETFKPAQWKVVEV